MISWVRWFVIWLTSINMPDFEEASITITMKSLDGANRMREAIEKEMEPLMTPKSGKPVKVRANGTFDMNITGVPVHVTYREIS